MIIAELIRQSFRAHGSRVAISHGDRTRTYDEVWDRAVRLGNALTERGIVKGDRVATLGPNDLCTIEEMVGLALGGYVRTALHGMNSGEAHRQMIEASGARALLTHADYYERFSEIFESIPGLEVCIIHDAPDARGADYETALSAASDIDAHVAIAADDVIHLAYSSGSTGTPRASIHTHESWMHVTTDNVTLLPRLTFNDVYLAAAPLTHAASTVLYALINRGASIQVMDHFDPADALELIESKGCTMTVMVPTMLQTLATHPDASTRDLSSLRCILYAGAPISVETARAAQAAFGNVLFQSYGQSECLPGTTLTPEDHALGASVDASLLRSAGRPCLNASIRLVDDRGHEVPTGEIGEILIKTEGRMRGIYGDPAATAARITDDGFVRTSDLGYFDARGYLFVVDRKDDMIISGGFNIWPAEIENVLSRHPAVAEALVVGVPHPKWGETPHAIVVVRPGKSVSAEELIQFCRNELGSMKKPTDFALRADPLPRTELGKLQRRKLRDQYWPAAEREREISGA
jgi:acyl-CoA synthetase (AMP-forming)/AMP-acid ligase II